MHDIRLSFASQHVNCSMNVFWLELSNFALDCFMSCSYNTE